MLVQSTENISHVPSGPLKLLPVMPKNPTSPSNKYCSSKPVKNLEIIKLVHRQK